MKKRPVPLLGSRTLDAHQELAAAVIKQALIDAIDPNAPERVREGARTFLAGSPMLRQWCHVAGLEVSFLEAKRRARETRQARAAAAPVARPTAAPKLAPRPTRSSRRVPARTAAAARV